MPNIKISAAADAGTLLASDMLPLARSGDTNAYHATMAEISTFTTASVASGAYGNVGRNLLHNGLFNVAQRGAGPWTTNVYTFDRWAMLFNLDAMNVGPAAFGIAGIVGDEEASTAAWITVTGNAGAAAFSLFHQPIERVKRLSGKTVTVSFVAYATSGTPRLGVNLRQRFGTGGSPSADVIINGQAVTLSTAQTRYSVTFTLPSLAGKTLGTNGDDNTDLRFWFSSGATNNPEAGNIGVQSDTFALWGVQLELGSTATPLEKLDPQQDLAKCQRFYCTGFIRVVGGSFGTGLIQSQAQPFPVFMRAVPTVTPTYTTQQNCTGGVNLLDAGSFQPYSTATFASNAQVNLAGTYTASADL
jgi:hypothetical protein